MSISPGAGTVRVYDPRGEVRAEKRPVAARVRDLAGLRLGILDNTKWNGNKLLRGAAARLEAEIPFAKVGYWRKESFSKNADPALLAEIAANSDIVITAIGD